MPRPRRREQFAILRPRLATRFLPILVAAILSTPRARGGEEESLPPGFHQYQGRHLTLITDLPAEPEIGRLAELFDLAVPRWGAFFELSDRRLADWRVKGYLIQSRERMEKAGLVSPDVPPFTNGYASQNVIWFYNQTSPYYRRHLLLHEGTHAVMETFLGGFGPPWYAEGMAELLATHQWEEGELRLGVFPRRAEAFPGLGRIELVRLDHERGKERSFSDLLAMRGAELARNENYGWAWSTAAFLANHPRYARRFRALSGALDRDDFTARFRARAGADWPRLAQEWALFVRDLDYDHDFERTQIEFLPGVAPREKVARCEIAVDRGWQSSRIAVNQGTTYRVRARGRFQLAQEPAVWWCEPNGVTIRYFHGRPLGTLLATVCPDGKKELDPSVPEGVGLAATITPDRSGTLYFRINETARDLRDNVGKIEIEIEPLVAPSAASARP